MAEEKLNKFVINYLTEEQYAAALEAGTLNDNDFYCTSNDLENDEQDSTGAGAIIISTANTADENYDKIINSIVMSDAGQPRFIKSLIYEDLVYYDDWNGMPVYSYLTNAEGSETDVYMIFHGEDNEYIYDYTIHAYLDNEVKVVEQYSMTRTTKACVDNLLSSATKQALSANQGRVLAEQIAALEARIAALESGEVNNVAVDPTDTTDMNLWIQTS